MFAENLRKRLLYLGRRKRNRQLARIFIMVHRQNHKIKPVNRPALKVRERCIRKCIRQLDFTLAAPAAEQYGIPVLNFADGTAVRIDTHHGFQIIIGLSGLIGLFYGFGKCRAAALNL